MEHNARKWYPLAPTHQEALLNLRDDLWLSPSGRMFGKFLFANTFWRLEILPAVKANQPLDIPCPDAQNPTRWTTCTFNDEFSLWQKLTKVFTELNQGAPILRTAPASSRLAQLAQGDLTAAKVSRKRVRFSDETDISHPQRPSRGRGQGTARRGRGRGRGATRSK